MNSRIVAILFFICVFLIGLGIFDLFDRYYLGEVLQFSDFGTLISITISAGLFLYNLFPKKQIES